jgi:ABC-2 type transport system permease protein
VTKTYSATRALRRFGFRQTLKGALIIGVLSGLMMGAQGAAFAAAYPDQHSRDMLIKSFGSTPALGFMTGESKNIAQPASYAIYKSIALTTLIVAVWGLMTTTRLLRGQEEDGRLEPIVAGRTTKTSATVHILIGYAYSLGLSFLITWLAIGALGADPKVNLSFGNAGLLALGVFLPGMFFASLGVLTSQLALTRGRAVAYGLGLLLFFFSIRGAANSVSDWNNLKAYSPFGWTDLLNPVLGPNTWWILPTIIFSVVAIPLALYFASRRDLGESILPQSDIAKPHYYLLGSDLDYSIRQNIWPFVWWTIGTIAYAGLLASIAKVGADALSSSPAFTKVIGSLGGNYNDLVIAFLGFGGVFTALILLVMSAVAIGSIRNQEAKLYLDNILVQPVRRSAWLAKRISIIVSMAMIISLVTGYAIWQIATAQGVSLDLGLVLQNSIVLTGSVILLVGLGALLYGLLPRFAAIIMYVAIVWAFVADILKALFSLNDAIDKTSLLHYVSFAPTKTPDWTTFAWLVVIGFIAGTLGIIAFVKRDIVNE